MEVDFLPHENETGEKAVLDAAAAAAATVAVVCEGVIRVEISSAAAAAKTLPIVDANEYITRCVEEE